jgi:nitroimidazol reductase NimA-like FMN-containing flavoprotein (pyridoxamine 5'-phosphate oxidase superfamily)
MDDTPTEMDAAAVDAFLGNGGTGVLSLSSPGGESPYAVPVSYGYDAETGWLYFRLAVGGDSEKGDLDDRPVTFVTYGERGDGEQSAADTEWQSVVARGRLTRVEEVDAPTEALAGLDRVDMPLVEIFDRPLRTVEFAFVCLDPAELTGRHEATVGE